jgi:hypothetical protein
VSGKRARTSRRADERAAKQLVRDREKLFEMSPGGSRERPLDVPSAAVIEGRVEVMPCAQCEGPYRIREHASAGGGIRRLDVVCHRCTAPRSLWFRITSDEPN